MVADSVGSIVRAEERSAQLHDSADHQRLRTDGRAVTPGRLITMPEPTVVTGISMVVRTRTGAVGVGPASMAATASAGVWRRRQPGWRCRRCGRPMSRLQRRVGSTRRPRNRRCPWIIQHRRQHHHPHRLGGVLRGDLQQPALHQLGRLLDLAPVRCRSPAASRPPRPGRGRPAGASGSGGVLRIALKTRSRRARRFSFIPASWRSARATPVDSPVGRVGGARPRTAACGPAASPPATASSRSPPVAATS